MLGRVFKPEEDRPGITEVAVISYSLWQRRFGGDVNVIGRSLRIDDDLYTIVGVMPPGFKHPETLTWPEADLWYPAGFQAKPFPTPVRSERRSVAIARLKPGVTLPQAQAELDTISTQLQKEYPGDYSGNSALRFTVEPLQQRLVGDSRRAW